MNKLALSFALLSPFSAFAVKGVNSIYNPEIQSQSCLVEAKYSGNDKLGVCSSFVVEGNILLTAKHCVVKDPSRYKENVKNELQQVENLFITCNGSTVKGKSLQVHPKLDLAAIEIDAMLSSQIGFATEEQILEIQKDPKAYTCASFGYGLNNDNELRSFSGVIINDLKIYDFEEIRVEVAMDYDFKNMANYFANSMSSKIHFNQFFLPTLFKYGSVNILESTKSKFDQFWQKRKFNSIYDSQLGPKLYREYFSSFKDSYLLAMTESLRKEKVNRLKKQIPLITPVLNTNSYTNERAGFDYGDSGGVFACIVDNSWKAVALNSKISDSNKSYSTKPWEPMHLVPDKRVTKNGITIPVVDVIMDWILEI